MLVQAMMQMTGDGGVCDTYVKNFAKVDWKNEEKLIAQCSWIFYAITVSFDLQMLKGIIDTFVLIVHFLNH
jgi:hypothetical protein